MEGHQGSRAPSSKAQLGVCYALIDPFINESYTVNNASELVKKGIISESDLKLLNETEIHNTLRPDGNDERSMEISYLLIKKQYPHFSNEQILAHYQLYKTSCR